MRRKSERTSTKKAKPSPEKKVEKAKRTKTRRRKQSASSENESADDTSPVREATTVVEEPKPLQQTPVKEDSPEDAQDQVWQVKTAEGSSDGGEIKKLKICLTRPPTTPERADRSPRSRRKHSRATSSSDTPSVEAVDDRRKSKHRSKRTRESKDESDKNDSQGDEPDMESETVEQKLDQEISQSTETLQQATDETPMSTTSEAKTDGTKTSVESTASEEKSQNNKSGAEAETQNRSSDADTTVVSPKAETQESSAEMDTSSERHSPVRKRSVSVEKSEVLEIHIEENKCETSDSQHEKNDSIAQKDNEKVVDSKSNDPKEENPDPNPKDENPEKETPAKSRRTSGAEKVSVNEDKTNSRNSEEAQAAQNENVNATNQNDVVEGTENVEKKKTRNMSTDSDKDKNLHRYRRCSDSMQSTHEETVHNGQAAPIVVSRKRKWGSRPKFTSQKSLTISTDVLKDIIPDVKPVEFDEVIEEKKHHKRVEAERPERPVLPKIVIDNSENVEQHRKERGNNDNENVKVREPLTMNRRISIVKDNDNILIRPPSPPRYKQSNILYITNLVRPFTLPQLKNLLQRTGKLVENGFWIDRIKSKCFVKYESEDQAVETRHALHGVTWPVSNPKSLQVDFSTQEAFDKAKSNEETDEAPVSSIPGTVEDWLREQDLKREQGDLEKPWERKTTMREWDVGKNDKEKEKDKMRRDDRPMDKRRHRTPERSPEPARKFKKKEEEAPAKLLDDLFRKTKTTPCIYWLPLSAETIAIKEEQRRQHMAEHERRLQELRRTHRRH